MTASRVFIVIALVLRASPAECSTVGGSEEQTSTSLADWLQSLVIEIPAVNLTVATVEISLLEGGNCSMMSISQVSSDIVQGKYTNDELMLGIYGLDISCSLFGRIKDTALALIDTGPVGVEVDLSNSSFAGSLTILGDPSPEALKLSECSSKINIAGLDFVGQDITAALLHELAQLFLVLGDQVLGPILCDGLGAILSLEVGPILETVSKDLKAFIVPAAPPAPPSDASPGIYDFEDSKFLLATSVAANALVPEIDSFINEFTGGKGAISIPLNESHITLVNMTSFGLISIDIQNINIGGLNTTSAIKGPSAISSDNVQLHLDMEDLSVSVDVRLTVKLSQGLLQGNSLVESSTIGLDLQGLDVGGSMVLDLKAHKLSVLKIDQLLHPGCLLKVADGVNVSGLYLGFSRSVIKLEAHNNISLDENLYGALENTATYILEAYQTIIEAIIQSQINSEALSLIQDELATLLDSARAKYPTCPKADTSEMSKTGTTSIVWGVISGTLCVSGFLCILLGYFAMMRQQEARSKNQFSNAAMDETNRALIGEGIVARESSSQALRIIHSSLKSSLAYSISSSELIAVGLVLSILANIALLISSNTATGASVELFLTYESDTGEHGSVQLPRLFAFSLSNSIRGMWQAGVYPISLMIAVFSGAWPYAKLLLMLACALAPTSSLSATRRQRLLRFLDAYGKWSLIDSFVLVLFLVAFRIHMQTPPVYGSGESAALDIFVFPRYGFYSFLVGTITSLFIGHILSHMSRKSRRGPEMAESHASSKQRLSKMAFVNPDIETQTLFAAVISQVVSVCVIGSLGLVLWSSFEKAFEFKLEGLTGVILGDDADRSYSLVSLGNDLAGSAKNPKSFGVNFIGSTFFVFALAMPVVHLTLLSALWLLPMGRAHRRRMSTACRIFDAWSGMDVYIISVIAAVLEVEQFAQFIIGSKCDLINSVLKAYFDGALHGNDTCFDLTASLDIGAWAVFGSALFYFITSRIVHWVDIKVQEQEEKSQLPYGSSDEDNFLTGYEHLDDGHAKSNEIKSDSGRVRLNEKKSKSSRKAKNEKKVTIRHVRINDGAEKLEAEAKAQASPSSSTRAASNDIEEINGEH